VGAGGCDSLRPPDLLKGLRYLPGVLVTDKLGSYQVAHRELMSSVEHGGRGI
jgi:transposase-like protein